MAQTAPFFARTDFNTHGAVYGNNCPGAELAMVNSKIFEIRG